MQYKYLLVSPSPYMRHFPLGAGYYTVILTTKYHFMYFRNYNYNLKEASKKYTQMHRKQGHKHKFYIGQKRSLYFKENAIQIKLLSASFKYRPRTFFKYNYSGHVTLFLKFYRKFYKKYYPQRSTIIETADTAFDRTAREKIKCQLNAEKKQLRSEALADCLSPAKV